MTVARGRLTSVRIPAERLSVQLREHADFPNRPDLGVGELQRLRRKLVDAPELAAEVSEVIQQLMRPPNAAEMVAAAKRAGEAQPVQTNEGAIEDARLMEALSKTVIGQERAKAGIVRFMRAARSGFTDKPKSIVIGGPPGVGKTQMGKAVAAAVHGDPEKVIIVNCGAILTEPDLNKIFGANEGMVGYSADNKSSPLAPSKIQAMYGDASPERVVIVWDEIDKIKDPAVREALFSKIGGFLQNGKLELNNGQILELPNAINIFATNAGSDTAQGLEGDALVDHYINEATKMFPDYIISRVKNIEAADPLTKEESSQIAKLVLDKGFKEAIERAKDQGLDVTFEAKQDVYDLLGEIALSPRFGARPLESIIEELVYPLLAEMKVNDDEHYVLNIKDGFEEGSIDRRKLAQQFQKAAPKVPSGVTVDNFAIKIKSANAKPTLRPYDAELPPQSPDGAFQVLGTGMSGSRAFIVSNQGEVDSPNEMYEIVAGAKVRGVRVPDQFVPVELPDAMLDAHSIDVVQLDEHRSMFISTTLPENSAEPELFAAIYDKTNKASPFTEVPAPPIALADAGVGAAGGKVVILGGRDIVKVGDHWTPSVDVELNKGMPMQPMGLEFDVATLTWRFLEDFELGNMVPRAGYAVTEHDGKLYFAGGEQHVPGRNRTAPTTEVSKLVDIYDPATSRITAGPQLATATGHATAVSQGDHLEVLGGITLTLDPSTGHLERNAKVTIQDLKTTGDADTFKARAGQTLPEGLSGPLIPSVAGHLAVVFDRAGLEASLYRYSAEE